MIAVNLRGGLGNQLFQYAAGRRLALKHGANLVLDTSFIDGCQPGCTVRQYELNNFSINASISSTQEIILSQHQKLGVKNYFVAKMKTLIGMDMLPISHVCERGFTFNSEFMYIPDNSYLEGYWQSEKYFADIREIILEELQPRYPLSVENTLLAEQVLSSEAVSVHVRRGDFVSDSKTAEFHGHCSLDYYQRAFSVIEEIIPEPHYYFFSDDMDWVKKNINTQQSVTYVDQNKSRAYVDLHLMSLCSHHIIANSSFSWWGAWLCIKPSKIVIAPDPWFQDKHLDTSDLLPSSWQLVEI